MEKRPVVRATVASKSGIGDSAKETRATSTTPRLSATRASIAGSQTAAKTSPLTPRVASTAASKAPTRPLATTATLRKPTAPVEEVRRPIRAPPLSTLAAKTPSKAEALQDVSKRNATDGAHTVPQLSARRSLTASRPSVTTPTTSRPLSRAAAATPDTSRPLSRTGTTRLATSRSVRSPETVRSSIRVATTPKAQKDASNSRGTPTRSFESPDIASRSPKTHLRADVEDASRLSTINEAKASTSSETTAASKALQQELSIDNMEGEQSQAIAAENVRLKKRIAELEQGSNEMHPDGSRDAGDEIEDKDDGLSQSPSMQAKPRSLGAALSGGEQGAAQRERELQHDLQGVIEARAKLEQEVESLRKEMDQRQIDFDRDAHDQAQVHQDVVAKHAALALQLEEERRRSGAKIASLQTLKDEGANETDLLRQTFKEELEKEREKSKVELGELTTRQRAIETQLRNAEDAFHRELEEERVRSEESVQQLRAAHDEASARLHAEHQAAIGVVLNDKDRIQKTLAESHDLLETIKAQHGEEIAHQRKTTEEVQAELNHLRTAASESAALMAQLEQEQSAIRKRETADSMENIAAFEDLLAKHQASEQALGTSATTISDLQSEIEVLRDEKAATEARNTQLRDEVRQLADELRQDTENTLLDKQSSEKIIREFYEQVTKLEDELSSTKERAASAADTSREELSASAAMSQELRERLETTNTKHEEARESLTRQIGTLEEEVDRTRGELRALATEHDSQKDAHKRAQEAAEAQRQELEVQLTALTEENKHVPQLQDQLRDLHTAHEASQVAHSSEVSKMQQDLEALRGEALRTRQTYDDDLGKTDIELAALREQVARAQEEVEQKEHVLQTAHQAFETREREAQTLAADFRAESEETVRRLKEDLDVKSEELASLHDVVANLQAAIRDSEQATADAQSHANETAEEQRTAINVLQDELSKAMQQIHDEKTVQTKSTQENAELLEQYRGLTERYEKMTASYQELEHTHAQHSAEMAELRDAMSASQVSKELAEKSLSGTRIEIEGLQKVLDSLLQDTTEKDAAHTKAMEALQSELERALEEVQVSATIAVTMKALQEKYEELVAERSTFEKRLSDATIQHNREMEEESQKHESAYRELQETFGRVRSAQDNKLKEHVSTNQQQIRDLQAELLRVQHEHGQELLQVRTEHVEKMEPLIRDHAIHVSELHDKLKATQDLVTARTAEGEQQMVSIRQQHEEKMHALRQEYASKTGEILSQHAVQLEAAKFDAAQTLESRILQAETQHAAEMATLKEELKHALERMDSLDAVRNQPTVTGPGSTTNLEHVFVNHQDAGVPNRQDSVQDRSADHDDLEQTKMAVEKSPVNNDDCSHLISTKSIIEPSSPIVHDHKDGAVSKRSAMSLEGTLESLRVQTEQLLELNDDWLSEHRQWRQKFGTRANGHSPRAQRRNKMVASPITLSESIAQTSSSSDSP